MTDDGWYCDGEEHKDCIPRERVEKALAIAEDREYPDLINVLSELLAGPE